MNLSKTMQEALLGAATRYAGKLFDVRQTTAEALWRRGLAACDLANLTSDGWKEAWKLGTSAEQDMMAFSLQREAVGANIFGGLHYSYHSDEQRARLARRERYTRWCLKLLDELRAMDVNDG